MLPFDLCLFVTNNSAQPFNFLLNRSLAKNRRFLRASSRSQGKERAQLGRLGRHCSRVALLRQREQFDARCTAV